MWWLFFAFAFGATTGSFLNVCIYRVPRGESIASPPSHCTFCNQYIRWYDNLPLLSYLLLRGKCRRCGAVFSPRYFLIELLTAGLFAALCWKFFVFQKGWGFHDAYWRHVGMFVVHVLLVCALIVASFIDLDLQIIPDEISLPGVVLALVASLLLPGLHDVALDLTQIREPVLHFVCRPLAHFGAPPMLAGLVAGLLGAIAGGGVIAVTGAVGKLVFKKQAMGGGDVKLMAMIGAVMGWQLSIFTFVLACFVGVVGGMLSVLLTRSSRIPFGPYLSGAAVALIFFSTHLTALVRQYFRWVQELL